jgi:hypothetical protein
VSGLDTGHSHEICSRGCLESPRKSSEPLPLWARDTVRRLPGKAPQHQPTHGQVNQGRTALREGLVIFAPPSGAPDPGNRAFHHPPARQHGEGRYGRRLHIDRVPAPAPRALDDVQGPPTLVFHPGTQPLPTVRHVRPDVSQPLTGLLRGGQQPGGRVRLPQSGGMDEDTPQETRRLNEEMALATVECLGAIVAVAPPFAVVLTVWASMMAAEGCG